jgi:hypothetical protein
MRARTCVRVCACVRGHLLKRKRWNFRLGLDLRFPVLPPPRAHVRTLARTSTVIRGVVGPRVVQRRGRQRRGHLSARRKARKELVTAFFFLVFVHALLDDRRVVEGSSHRLLAHQLAERRVPGVFDRYLTGI